MGVDDVVCAGECAFKLEISIYVRCLQRQELYHPALKVYASIFTPFWNEIIKSLREKDYVRYREMDLLMMPSNCEKLRLVQWPLFLLTSKEIDYLKMAVAKIKAHQI